MTVAYDARSVALTVGCTVKWVDNLLSHFQLPGVSGGRQGVQRVITFEGVVAIEVTRVFVADLGLPLRHATEFARLALGHRSGNELRVTTADGVTLLLRADEIEARLRERLVGAAESVARVRRGRPPQSASPSTETLG